MNDKAFDPFEMGDFSSAASSQDIENAIGLLDKRIMEMKVGAALFFRKTLFDKKFWCVRCAEDKKHLTYHY